MDMPPTRFRVVEHGRRLIVIDTHRGNAPVTGLPPAQQKRIDSLRARLEDLAPPARASAAPMPSAPAPLIERGDPKLIETRRWFDNKAPRRVKLSSEAQGTATMVLVLLLAVGGFAVYLIGWPVIFVAGLFFQPRVRNGFRAAVTGWLDGVEQGTGRGAR